MSCGQGTQVYSLELQYFYVANDGFLDRSLKGGVTTPSPRTAAWAARVQTPGRTAAMRSVPAAMPPVKKWLFKSFFIIKMAFIFPQINAGNQSFRFSRLIPRSGERASELQGFHALSLYFILS